MNSQQVATHITNWLSNYANQAKANGFIIGISGGIDSALTSTLCAHTGKTVFIASMPIHQTQAELSRAKEHMKWLKDHFTNVTEIEVDITATFETLKTALPQTSNDHFLAMANTRSRLRMTTLYALAQPLGLLVAGTGNKIEDFGVGFYTKYGDGGVDLSPIADLTKSQVRALASHFGVVTSIIEAAPTDGLWEDGRTDEDQIGATYPELEWAMEYVNEHKTDQLSERQAEVLTIYTRLNRQNQHKMQPIPVCEIPKEML